MIADITAYRVPGNLGWRLKVRLDISPEEQTLYHRNSMGELDVVQAGKDGQFPLKFSSFYQEKMGHVLTLRSSHQAILMKGLLTTGFAQINQFFARNRADPNYTPEPLAWNFFDRRRFEHTHIVGESGTGKTTLLSALIDADLDRVKAGTASVVVIDGQDDRLSKHFPRSPRFAPGGDLEGKLVYIGYEFPPALNIFDVKGETRTAEHMLRFFIGSMGMEMSGHMHNIIRYSLKAIRLMPNPTVRSLKLLLEKKGLPEHLDPDTRDFLLTRVHSASYAMTLAALRARLDGFTADDFFNNTFKQPENKFDLYEILQEPKVVVINTNHGELGDISQPYGRYFLAGLLRASRRRNTSALPAYVFVDEAHQYIAQEEAVTELLDEARKKNMALTFAHQRSKQITSATVLSALNDAAVQLRPAMNYKWYASVRKAPDELINPPPTDFSKHQMTRPQWQTILKEMEERFGQRTVPIEPRPTDDF